MLFRVSSDLATRIGVEQESGIPLSDAPLEDWSGHLFTCDRRKYVILVNTPSLYGFVVPAAGMPRVPDFAPHMCIALMGLMYRHGTGDIYESRIAPHTGNARYAKALNRSVSGSISDLMRLAKFYLMDGCLLNEVNARLHRVPMGAMGYRQPTEVLHNLAKQ